MSEASDIAWALRCAARLVGAVFDLPPETFTSPKKGPPAHVHARQVLIYVLHTEADFEQATIAEALRRHHSTIWHAIQVVDGMREQAEVDRALTRIGEMFRDLRDANARIPALVEELAA